jgi:hypothetical protein
MDTYVVPPSIYPEIRKPGDKVGFYVVQPLLIVPSELVGIVDHFVDDGGSTF